MDIHIHGNPARLYAGADPGFWKGGVRFPSPPLPSLPSFPPLLSLPFLPLPFPTLSPCPPLQWRHQDLGPGGALSFPSLPPSLPQGRINHGAKRAMAQGPPP